MQRTKIKELLTQRKFRGKEVLAKGWIKTARHSKEVTFLEVTDGSCLQGIQIVVEPSLPNYAAEIRKLHTGCSVSVKGKLVKSPAKGQKYEIQASDIDVVGWAKDYPLQKKRHSFEYLRSTAHLRSRTNSIGAVFRVRNAAAWAIHEFFQEHGFIYLHTPIITASDCEGAGEMFRVSTLEAKNPPLTQEGEVDFSQDFFGRQAYLTVSGQLEAEIGALSHSDVYTFGPTFRAENSNTSRHLAEFWMVEPEMAFCDLDGDMDLAEEFLQYIIEHVLQSCEEDMEFFNKFMDKELLETLQSIVNTSFERVSYTEAVDILQKSGKEFDFPVEWGKDLQSEHERFLTENHFKKPVIVNNYPAQIKPFYMYMNEDGKTVRAMDILVPKIGEIIGGSQREDREDILKQRLKQMGLPESNYWWYIELRTYGSVPHSGFGLGFERFIQFITGMSNIRDVIPFPRVPGHADF